MLDPFLWVLVTFSLRRRSFCGTDNVPHTSLCTSPSGSSDGLPPSTRNFLLWCFPSTHEENNKSRIMYHIGCLNWHIGLMYCISPRVGHYLIDTQPTTNRYATWLLTKSQPLAHWYIGTSTGLTDVSTVTSLVANQVNNWWHVGQLSILYQSIVKQESIASPLILSTNEHLMNVAAWSNIDQQAVDISVITRLTHRAHTWLLTDR